MTAETTSTARVVLASSDTHVSPTLTELRPFCERKLLDEFDAYAAVFEADVRAANERADREATSMLRDFPHGLNAGGHDDMRTRLDEMDREGIAAEVIFHGTQGDSRRGGRIMWPIPWSINDRSLIAGPDSTLSAELATAGRRIYNRWLADFCSLEPERHAGLCQIPIWDMDATVDELRWGKEHGLKGVNFPSPGASFGGLIVDSLNSEYPALESDYWAPLFTVASELGMPLTTHVGHPILPPRYSAAGGMGIILMEQNMLSCRSLWHLIFSGAFDRYPELTLVLTEVLGLWFGYMISYMESIYENTGSGPGEMIRGAVEKTPRYVDTNVYFGTSFMFGAEAESARELGLVERVGWGSDYPHHEGTWHPDHDVPPCTPLSLQNTFHGFAESDIRAMVGGNMVRAYGFDATALAEVAERVGPHVEDLMAEPAAPLKPSEYHGLGFRDRGGPYS